MKRFALAVICCAMTTSILAAPKPCDELKAEIEAKIQAKKDSLKAATADEKKAKLKAEAKINESRLAEIAKKNAAAAAEALAPKEEEPAGETETTEENPEA